ncbi:acyltransferase domain-containing protein, partial [Micromonospora sp. NPDC049460]|uniref:acyltransferase domain-containing protein n=1 Tax=Micromonospora sp. NPDC049460 TaxID=3364272 RepID=UPI0037B6FFF7
VGRRVGGVLASGGVGLADVAYTLQVGRRHFERRRAVVCRDATQAAAALTGADPERLLTGRAGDLPPALVFLFPGGGSQYVGMGRQLYATEPVFAEHLDRCADLAAPRLGYDLRAAVLAPDGDRRAAEILDTTAGRLTALFAVEYALAKLWESWGVRPEAMLGHSSGEYVAACLAGVFDLADVIDTVALRGQLIDRLPDGAMLAVNLPEHDAARYAGDDLDVAAVNGPEQTVLSGPATAVEAARAALDADGVRAKLVRVRQAAHTRMLDPLLAEFAAHMATVTLRPPQARVGSNVTGTWLTAVEATDPGYWVRHLRATVRFGDNLRAAAALPDAAFLEVGPGHALGTMALAMSRAAGAETTTSIVASLPAAPEQDENETLLSALARLWLAGAAIDWTAFSAGEQRRRVPLPTYPFERRRYSLLNGSTPAAPEAPATAGPKHDRPDLPTEYEPPRTEIEETVAQAWRELLGYREIGVFDDFLLLGGDSLLTGRLVARLQDTFQVPITVAEAFARRTVAQQADLLQDRLLAELEGLSDADAERLMSEADPSEAGR